VRLLIRRHELIGAGRSRDGGAEVGGSVVRVGYRCDGYAELDFDGECLDGDWEGRWLSFLFRIFVGLI